MAHITPCFRPPIMVLRRTTIKLGPGEMAPSEKTAPAASKTSQATASMPHAQDGAIQPWPCWSKEVEGHAGSRSSFLLRSSEVETPPQHACVRFALRYHPKVGRLQGFNGGGCVVLFLHVLKEYRTPSLMLFFVHHRCIKGFFLRFLLFLFRKTSI